MLFEINPTTLSESNNFIFDLVRRFIDVRDPIHFLESRAVYETKSPSQDHVVLKFFI